MAISRFVKKNRTAAPFGEAMSRPASACPRRPLDQTQIDDLIDQKKSSKEQGENHGEKGGKQWGLHGAFESNGAFLGPLKAMGPSRGL